MISVAEAIALIKANTSLLPSQTIALGNSLGLALAEDVLAQSSVPPFHQSSMDGYAFCYDDYRRSKAFTVSGEVAAGDASAQAYDPQTAVRIFTGAPLPPWADTVVMQEKTERSNERTVVVNDEQIAKGDNVRRKGSDIKESEIALAKGTVLIPAAIGFLAGVGTTQVSVYPAPSVCIIVTGNELQQPGKPLSGGQVYESNSVMLQAALQQLGVTGVFTTEVKDDITALQDAINTALQTADLVLLTGGVSVGDYDFVVKAVEACGVKRLFHKVAQRPGKPLYCGIKEGKMVFGLPGNPASVLSCFYNYVVVAVESLTGRSNLVERRRFPLLTNFSKTISLTQFLKAAYNSDGVTPLTAQDSFRLSSFAVANCLIVLPAETKEYKKGEVVETLVLPYL